MNLLTVLLVVILVLFLVGSVPIWPHANAWGYGPSGVVAIVLVIVVVLALRGRL